MSQIAQFSPGLQMQSITNLIVDCTKFNLPPRPYGLVEYVSDLIYGKANLNSICVTLDTHVGLVLCVELTYWL